MITSSRLVRFLLLSVALLGCPKSQPAAPAKPLPVVRVDVWHDTICPWCRIGLHNLDRVVAETKDVKVEVVHHAFLLDPETPPEGRDLRAYLGARFGADDRVNAMFERVSAAGAPFGVHFNWEKVRLSPDTTASHTLISWAPIEKRAALVAALHKAHFEAGENLGDVGVLARLAKEAGLDEAGARAAVSDATRRENTRAEARIAASQGITGVPHFVIGGQTLNGAQPPEALSAAIRAAAR